MQEEPKPEDVEEEQEKSTEEKRSRCSIYFILLSDFSPTEP